ncbi:hypothetical protein L9F63_003154, partial [Diploptera punctata]
MLWILICEISDQKKFTIVTLKEYGYASVKRHIPSEKDDIYTVASANLLLAPEIIARLNNITNSYARTLQITERILRHTGRPLNNLINKNEDEIKSKCNSVLSEFPELDFLCLQEVWERNYALMLIEELKKEFFYYVYDIGEYSLQKNYCMLGSGLFFASKKPILDVDFFTFTFRTKHAKLTTQGVLCVKVLLHYEENGDNHVGYIANVHTQAFQGTDAVLLSQLTDIRIFTSLFKDQKTLPGDIVDFDIVCGDFNSDNMSPADLEVQQHCLFEEYQDICVEKVGNDVDWAIGTELRQSMLYQPEMENPEYFRELLIDDSLRRKYVLDADVLIHSTHLMTSVAKPGANGFIDPLPYGGKRRVDKILYRGNTSDIVGYCFLSTLTNLTDHLPVCMSFKPWLLYK